jgi:hypothetical protein
MSEPWNERAAGLFRVLRIESPFAFKLGGRSFAATPSPPGAPAGAAPAGALPGAAPFGAPPGAAPVGPALGGGVAGAAQPLLGLLGDVLYHHVYSRPFDGRLAPARQGVAAFAADPDLLQRLSQANGSRERWEHGWQIDQVMASGQVMARRGNGLRAVWPGQFLSRDGPGSPPRPGMQISLFYLKESTSLQPGFYYLFGETPEEDGGAGFTLVRAYWNVDAAGAPSLVRLLSARLNRFHVPFRFKVSVVPSQFERTDVAVIYLTKRSFPIFSDLLTDIHPQLRGSLGEDVPFLAKPIAAGVGIAEDPGNGESFGQHRCRILAETVWNCFLKGNESLSARLSELRRLLAANGVDPHRLYLNAGSIDAYELAAEAA